MISKTKVQKSIQKILAGYIGRDIKVIALEHKLVEDLALTSFDLIYIVAEIEDKLNVAVDISSDFAQIVTVSDLCDYAFKLVVE